MASVTDSPVAIGGRRPTNFPWIILDDMVDGGTPQFAHGGIILKLKAGATLLIGDAVYISAAFTVNKSTSSANGLLRCGVVVGGVQRAVESTTLEVRQKVADVGTTAALVNQDVLVCINGICLVKADGAITAGTQIKPSTSTAGQVTPTIALSIATGAVAVTSVAANGASDIAGDGPSPILGQALDAAAGTNDVIRAIISF